jgi:hypothetical protein
MSPEQRDKLVKWLASRESIEDLYEIADLLWKERVRRLREADKNIIPYSPPKEKYIKV